MTVLPGFAFSYAVLTSFICASSCWKAPNFWYAILIVLLEADPELEQPASPTAATATAARPAMIRVRRFIGAPLHGMSAGSVTRAQD